MTNFTHPRWLYLTSTLPLLLLSWFGYRQYALTESLLDAFATRTWVMQSIAVLLVLLLGAGVAYGRERMGKRLNVTTVTLLFVANLLLLVSLFNAASDLQPWSIPRWLRENNIDLYTLTALMPVLVHCLFVALVELTPRPHEASSTTSFLMILAAPFVVWVVGMILVPIAGNIDYGFEEYLMALMVALGITLVVFFIAQFFYIQVNKRERTIPRAYWLVPVAILAPLIGLALNQGMFGGENMFDPNEAGVFGSFGHPAFFLIALANGILLLLKEREDPNYRLYLFLGRAAGFSYVTYFFLIFLPYLPLSVPLILFIGVGLLMLTPLALFIVQGNTLRKDLAYLGQHYHKGLVYMGGMITFLILPVAVTIHYKYDGVMLERALTHVYAPGEGDGETVSRSRLDRVLRKVSHRNRGGGFLTPGNETPYLGTYYRWLVLDNQTLANEKIQTLRQVYMGVEPYVNGRRRSWNRQESDVLGITDHAVNTRWDAARGCYVSNVDLTVSNEGGFQREFSTEFDLPAGAFISDYYLDIEGRREHGILSERKAATWVYNNIVNARRDPGFLRYTRAGRLAFNVFPVPADSLRTTGFEVLHRDPVTIIIDSTKLVLGDTTTSQPVIDANADAGYLYLNAAAHATLPRAPRPRGVHFILDASRRRPDLEDAELERLDAFVASLPAGTPPPRITLAGTYPVEMAWNENWRAALAATTPGGFFAQRALGNALRNDWEAGEETDWQYVLVPIGTSPVWTDDLDEIGAATGYDNFYWLTDDLELDAYAFGTRELVSEAVPIDDVLGQTSAPYYERDGRRWFLPDSTANYLLPLTAPTSAPAFSAQNDWTTAAQLYATALRDPLLQETGTAAWLNAVQGSFASGTLQPVTAFLALENDAQKEALRRKQNALLNARATMDADAGNFTSMSEPEWLYWVGLLLLGLVAYRTRLRQ